MVKIFRGLSEVKSPYRALKGKESVSSFTGHNDQGACDGKSRDGWKKDLSDLMGFSDSCS